MALKNEAEKVFDEAILLLIKRAQSRDDWKKYVREENFLIIEIYVNFIIVIILYLLNNKLIFLTIF